MQMDFRRVWRGGGLYPVLLPAAPEGGLIDSKDIGGFLQRFYRGKHTADMFFFDLLDGDWISDFRRGFQGREFLRKVFGADLIRLAEDGGPLDHIAQFSDVSWPGIGLEDLYGITGKTEEPAMVYAAIE